jgi:hypothetical protein
MGSWRSLACLTCGLVLGLGCWQLAAPARAGFSPEENPGVAIPTPNVEPPAASTVLLPSTGAEDANGLPATSSQPQAWTAGDVSGGYRIASNGSATSGALAVADGDRANVAISADARLVVDNNTASDAIVRLGCRYQGSASGYSGYGLSYSPSGNTWSLDRFDQGVDQTLTGVQYLTGAAFLYDAHHLQLTCSGSSLSATIDGRQVGSVQDGTYKDGEAMVGVGMFTRDQGFLPFMPAGSLYAGTLDVRFSNLSFSQP